MFRLIGSALILVATLAGSWNSAFARGKSVSPAYLLEPTLEKKHADERSKWSECRAQAKSQKLKWRQRKKFIHACEAK